MGSEQWADEVCFAVALNHPHFDCIQVARSRINRGDWSLPTAHRSLPTCCIEPRLDTRKDKRYQAALLTRSKFLMTGPIGQERD